MCISSQILDIIENIKTRDIEKGSRFNCAITTTFLYYSITKKFNRTPNTENM